LAVHLPAGRLKGKRLVDRQDAEAAKVIAETLRIRNAEFDGRCTEEVCRAKDAKVAKVV
jgi:hypothetical protein